MNIASFCIRNNRTTAVVLLLIILLGVHTFKSISRLENPEFIIRTAVVSTEFPGATPERVEKLVTDKLEKKIREIPEVQYVYSQSLAGLSFVFVDVYEKYMDMAPIWNRLRNKVEQVSPELPPETSTPYVDDEFGDVFGIVMALRGDGFTNREMKDTADAVRDELLKLDNVGKVNIYGVQEERVFIEFSNARLAEYGFTPYQISSFLESQNIIQPSGNALLDRERVLLDSTGEFKSIDDIRKVSLRAPGGNESVLLEDLATITRDYIDPPTTLTRFNGETSLVIAVNMSKGGNIIDLGKRVEKRLSEIEAKLPIGLDFQKLAYQPKFVKRAIDDFTGNVVQAFVCVMVVMFLFAGMQLGIITGLLVPMAMLASIALMPLFDVNLQTISIASLIIALGMLVDNGVVVSEDILVRLARGEDRLDACAAAVKELWIPLLSASLTTILAFLPIPLADSAVGEYCLSLFIVITITLLASWVLSLTMVPLLCYYILKPKKEKQEFDSSMHRIYRPLLSYCLKHRALSLGVMGILFAASLWAFGLVPKIFFPSNEREMFLIDFWLPYGTDIRETAKQTASLEDFLLKDNRVESVGTFVGSGGPRWYLALNVEQDNPNYAFILVNTKGIKKAKELMAETRKHLDRFFPEVRHTVSMLENGPPVGAPIQIRLLGDDIGKLFELRNHIESTMNTVPGITNIRDNWGEWTKKLEVKVNQDAAKRAGLTSQDIALSLQTQISGLHSTELREGDEVIPIVIRSKESYRQELGKISGLNVFSYTLGRSVPLLQVATTKLRWHASNIQRRNQVRTLTIKCDLIGGRLASETLDELRPLVEKLRASNKWHPGYEVEYGGEFEDSKEAEEAIYAGLPLALGLILVLLIAQFNSIRRTAVILLTIPPMIVGITPGLLLTSSPFGFMAFLGMISLMGIIVNNAIMMIDRIEIERSQGKNVADAVFLAAQQRLRPILMTASSTIVGLVPLSLSGGEFWRPMANTIIFGLFFATVLTLVLCPVLYSLFFGHKK